ncbi:hypothetical protein NCS52_01101000 [Fusarium sp. LHS14.1]|nr:hypothetical protein NCS52_01101000 [Fusarium sp. LHS14.1]
MATGTAEALILGNPTHPVHNTLYVTGSDKPWARTYKPITNTTSHTFVGGDGITYANFNSAFLPLLEDDALRMSQPAVPPNSRRWRFDVEADIENWFNTEIVNVVLSAWYVFPPMTQASHAKPLSEDNIPENIDSAFSIYAGSSRFPIAIGEIKRNLLEPDAWLQGGVAHSRRQVKLSQELQGYAHKYQCPQVFCFDGSNLLLLQFRASEASAIEDERCPVDCWILPMSNSACTIRFGLYRLLAQGWRRCQTKYAPPLSVGGLTMHSREFFNGQPIWKHGGKKSRSHPGGYERSVDTATGALKWTRPGDDEVVWETDALW